MIAPLGVVHAVVAADPRRLMELVCGRHVGWMERLDHCGSLANEVSSVAPNATQPLGTPICSG